jgi:negative regulator of sigma E activity
MTRAKRVAVALVASAVLASAANGFAATPSPSPAPAMTPALTRGEDDARAIELLRASMTAARAVSYVAQMQTIRWGPSGATASITKVEHLAPDQTHRIYLAPQEVYGDSVVIRGPEMTSYDNKHQKVVVSRGPIYDVQTTANDNFGLLVANYRPVVGNPEAIAGRSALPCSLVNRYTGERVMRIWIDVETKLVLQKETYHANGTIGSRTQFEQIRYTKDISPQVFATPVPSGYAIVKGRESGSPSTDLERVLKEAGFTPAGPHYLPEGFTIVSADVVRMRGVKTLHLLYSDGVRTLSLFENAVNAAADFGGLKPIATKVEDHDAYYVNDGPTTLLSWKESGLMLALVGDLDIKELKAIAASVIP